MTKLFQVKRKDTGEEVGIYGVKGGDSPFSVQSYFLVWAGGNFAWINSSEFEPSNLDGHVHTLTYKLK